MDSSDDENDNDNKNKQKKIRKKSNEHSRKSITKLKELEDYLPEIDIEKTKVAIFIRTKPTADLFISFQTPFSRVNSQTESHCRKR